MGIHKNYLKYFDDNEFNPVKKATRCKEDEYRCFLHPIVSV
ncbi:MAG: hypothetical protein WC643_03370 [Parcubacteria group bacterium]|jgi:hypothetical protein